MAEGRSRQLWDIGGEVLAALWNGLLRKAGSSPFTPADFNPHLKKERKEQASAPVSKEESKEGFAVMRAVFVKDGPG